MLLLGFGGGVIVTAANALVSDINPARRGTTLNLLNCFWAGRTGDTLHLGEFLSRNSIRLCYLVAGLTGASRWSCIS